MNIRAAFLAVSALALLGTSAVQAEDYHAHGVQPAGSALGRADVQAQAVAAAKAPGQNVSSSSVVLAAPSNPRDRMAVHAQAVRTAHAPDQNLGAGSRVNSQVVSTLPNAMDLRSQAAAGRAAR